MMRKNILAPSILSADFKHLGSVIKTAVDTGAEYLHFDVMDGMFVPSISFGMPVLKSIRDVAECVFDVHLMIEQPERYIKEFAECGADIITIHAEATKHLHRAVQQIKACGKKACVALNPATPLDVLDYVLEELDMVLLMTVNPGFGGQIYIPQMTEKIQELRRKITERKLNIDIEVDGGINETTIRTVLKAGANICVAGSAVFGEDIEENAKKLLNVMEEYTEY